MTNLTKCKECGSPAVEQIRGKMGPGDYKLIQIPNAKGHMIDDPDHYLKVEMNEDIRNDVRISCTKCENATGWNKADAPGMPGVGVTFTRDLWNKRNPVT